MKDCNKSMSIIAIVVLMLLRFPLLLIGQWGLINEEIAFLIYVIGTYLFTGVFICVNMNNLKDYFITPITIILFVISPVLSWISTPYDPTTYLRIILAIIVCMYLYKRRYVKNIKNYKMGVKISDIVLMLIIIGIAVIMKNHFVGKIGVAEDPLTFKTVFEMWAFQFSYAATLEEPLFRGIILGSLIKRGVNKGNAVLLQGVIFWLAHIYYFNTGINFWLLIPVISILIGLIPIKTESISNSMIVHSLVNTICDILSHY